MKKTLIFLSLLISHFCCYAGKFSYEEIAKRHQTAALSPESVALAKMQGECLVGLKDLNFKKMETFDPVGEWTNLRSFTLLEQYSPCEVLLIIEVAQENFKTPN